MATREAREARPRRACCLISEILEEAGLDRVKARQLQRQALEGVILFCQWQLERIRSAEGEASPPRPAARGRKVPVE